MLIKRYKLYKTTHNRKNFVDSTSQSPLDTRNFVGITYEVHQRTHKKMSNLLDWTLQNTIVCLF